MKWYKELSKAGLNLAVISIPVFIFGFLTLPAWRWYHGVFGVLWVLFFTGLSRWLWKLGGED